MKLLTAITAVLAILVGSSCSEGPGIASEANAMVTTDPVVPAFDKQIAATLLTEQEVRSIMSAPASAAITGKERTGGYAYLWSDDTFSYDLQASFWMEGNLSAEQAEKDYVTLTTAYTKEKDNPVPVKLGDVAQFSELGGSQLIVKTGSDILILSLFIQGNQPEAETVSLATRKKLLIETAKTILTKLKNV